MSERAGQRERNEREDAAGGRGNGAVDLRIQVGARGGERPESERRGSALADGNTGQVPPEVAGKLSGKALSVDKLSAWYGKQQALREISMEIAPNQVTAIIGPSGSGKSTFIRCLNRMHELVPGARVVGKVELDGLDIYAPNVDPVMVRRRIGMVFQRPNPFPTMSIFDNVAAGLKLGGGLGNRRLADIVEASLMRAALWDEVKDRLHGAGSALSGGQQQRLCIARALAVEPEVLLMDEPTGALDPASTLKIEELMRELREEVTIMIVTHNMQQAARVSDVTAFLLADEHRVAALVELGPTAQMFTTPRDKRTEDYITGRFG